MLPKKSKIKILGRREFVSFPLLKLSNIEAKIDTGAYTCSIHCKNINLKTENAQQVLYFQLLNNDTEEHRVDSFTQKKIKNSFGEIEERYIVKTLVHIGRKKINTTISLSDRGNMRYPVLIGRRLLKGKFIVDVSQIHTNGIKVKPDYIRC